MGRNITMSMNELMEESEASILHTYNRFPVVFEKARAVTSMIPKERNIWILRQVSL